MLSKGKQHPFFLISFFLKEIRRIYFHSTWKSEKFYLFPTISLYFFFLFELDFYFLISMVRIYLQSWSNLTRINWILTNPRFFPLFDNKIKPRASSCTVYAQPIRNWLFEQNKLCRAKSIFITLFSQLTIYRNREYRKKMVDVKIHRKWCSSSRTLLFPASSQTKFYHNSFFYFLKVWNWFNMESWIVIGSTNISS